MKDISLKRVPKTRKKIISVDRDFVPDSSDSESDSNDSGEDNVPIAQRRRYLIVQDKKSKRRMIHKDQWIVNRKKKAVNTGKYFFDETKCILAKKVQPGCKESCHLNCHQNLLPDQRQFIFENFWKIGNKISQWNFINLHCIKKKKKMNWCHQ